MGVILPLYGYVERQAGESEATRNSPTSAVNARRIEAVKRFAELIYAGIHSGHAQRFFDPHDIVGGKLSKSSGTFQLLQESYCHFESDLDSRPEFKKLIAKCTGTHSSHSHYIGGAIIITKVDDIFRETYTEASFDGLKQLVDLSIPIFAVEDGEIQDTIIELNRDSKRVDLYDRLVNQSLDYRKKMQNLLKRRLDER